MTKGCWNCDYEWCVRLPDGTITTIASGQLKKLNEDMMYEELKNPAVFGFFSELVGGNLGKLELCVLEALGADVEEFEVLIEGRWRKVVIHE